MNRKNSWLPFLGAWGIWIGGYGLLLGADFIVRRIPGLGQGLDELPVAVSATLIAGSACGFFLAAARRWSMTHRFALLLLQIPFAYLVAIALGFAYLCGSDSSHCS